MSKEQWLKEDTSVFYTHIKDVKSPGTKVSSILLLCHPYCITDCRISLYIIQNPYSRKKEENEKGTKDLSQVLLPSHWPEPGHIVYPRFRDIWEMQSVS